MDAFRMKGKLGRLLGLPVPGLLRNHVALSIKPTSPMTSTNRLTVSGSFGGGGSGLAAPDCPYAQRPVLDFLCGIVALLTSVALFQPEMRFPGWLALLPVAGAVAVMLAGPRRR